MERRKFPRQDVRGAPLKATLVLTGGSLLSNSAHSVEIETYPINLSRGGMSVSLGFSAVWATISPDREVDLCLGRDGVAESRIRAKIVRVQPWDHVLGLEFASPLENASPFLEPERDKKILGGRHV